jgi:hypothetical protein
VVVHQAHGLHERVADGGAHEAEAAPRQVLRDRVGLGRTCGHVGQRAPTALDRPAADEAPQIGVEAPVLALHLEERPRVPDARLHLEAVAHDAGVGEEPRALPRVEARDLRGIEAAVRAPIGLALAQHRDPREPRLRALEDQHLEETAVIVDRNAPLLVVIGDVERIVPGPAAAARGASGHYDRSSASRIFAIRSCISFERGSCGWTLAAMLRP